MDNLNLGDLLWYKFLLISMGKEMASKKPSLLESWLSSPDAFLIPPRSNKIQLQLKISPYLGTFTIVQIQVKYCNFFQ